MAEKRKTITPLKAKQVADMAASLAAALVSRYGAAEKINTDWCVDQAIEILESVKARTEGSLPNG